MESQSSVLQGPWRRIVPVLCILLVGLKLVQLALAAPFMDETYYWMWGQHPALSYYDHPPLNAWLLGLSSALFGWNLFALRLPVLLCFAADIVALLLISRRIGGEQWRDWFWLTLLLFLVTPVFWLVSSFALPDHTLLTALLFSFYWFFRFFQDRAFASKLSNGRPTGGKTRDLLLGALCLGLGGLAKYNAAFLGLGIGLFVLFFDRALLAQLRLWLAALVALALQTPVIVWNLTERFASWEFILEGRHAGLRDWYDGPLLFLTYLLLFISPFLFWPMGKFALGRLAIPGSGFARVAFILSSVAIVALAFRTQTLFHWNLVAYAAMLPFLAAYMRPRFLIVLQTLFGIAMAGAIFVNYSVTPITDVSGWRDEATAWSYGWSEVAAATLQAREDFDVGFVAAADYTTASLIAFVTGDANVVSLSPRQDQYDYWFDPAAHAGEDAILYGDNWRPLGGIVAKFDSVEPIASFPIAAGGRDLNVQTIYLARGFRPDG